MEPSSPRRRFANCARVALGAQRGPELEATVATTWHARLLGLARTDAEQIKPLLLPRCDAVHGFWMRADLDVCFLAMPAEGGAPATVLAVRVLRRRRTLRLAARSRRGTPRRRIAALELPAGTASRLGIAAGTRLAIGHTRAARP